MDMACMVYMRYFNVMDESMQGRWGKGAAAAAVLTLGCAGWAYAADLDTMATRAVAKQPSGPTSCTSPTDFFVTACQLSWYGVRLYGTVDVGGSYQTHGSPFDGNFSNGTSYFIQKASR